MARTVAWQDLLQQTAAAHRLAQAGRAASLLTELFDELTAQMPLLTPLQQKQLAAVLPQLMAAQQRNDLCAIADYLQFELTQILIGPEAIGIVINNQKPH